MKLLHPGYARSAAILVAVLSSASFAQGAADRFREAKQCMAFSMFSYSFLSTMTQGLPDTTPGLADARRMLEEARTSAYNRRRAVIYYAQLLPDAQRPSAEEINASVDALTREIRDAATSSGGRAIESLEASCARFDRAFAADQQSR